MTEITEMEEFLDPDLAADVSRFVTRTMPSDWWYASVVPGKGGSGPEHIRNSPEAEEHIRAAQEKAQEAMIRRQFAYFFYRTFPHVRHCRCAICRVITYMQSSEARERLATATGVTRLAAGEIFCSRYVSECFLGRHTDGRIYGQVAVSLSLSRTWHPEYGGLLHLMSQDGKVGSVATPRFNSLAFFTIPPRTGRWHFVSHVAPGVPEARLAISGWYKSVDSRGR